MYIMWQEEEEKNVTAYYYINCILLLLKKANSQKGDWPVSWIKCRINSRIFPLIWLGRSLSPHIKRWVKTLFEGLLWQLCLTNVFQHTPLFWYCVPLLLCKLTQIFADYHQLNNLCFSWKKKSRTSHFNFHLHHDGHTLEPFVAHCTNN